MPLDTRELFARLIQCEAGGEGEAGMAAVATVIMNRATATEGEFSRVNKGGGDVHAVITQPGQFVCMRESVDGSYNSQNVYNMTPLPEHYQIVDWALSGGRLVGVDNSLFFFNPYSSTCPTYFPTRVGVIHNRVGDHCFYIPTSYYAET
ncbi:MAG: cell wall hydrolase [Firmicutes bacterium]|nr:cell wall hydrolase [Bacillota bacterium]